MEKYILKNRINTKWMLVSLIFFSFCLNTSNGIAQTSEISEKVSALFDAMRESDGESVRKIFYEDISMKIVDHTENGTILTTSSAERFIEAVSNSKNDIWDERFDNLEVFIDGDLATAVMDYGFFLNETFSHCGQNEISFINDSGEWKIFSIIYSRRSAGCEKWSQ